MRLARVIRTQLVSVPNISRWLAVALLVGSALFIHSSAALAAEISYGNFVDPPSGTMFLNVTEGSATDDVPLYGPPDPFTTGLDFEPTSAFAATTSNGGSDITDGKLNFTIMNALGINDVSLFEGGDYSLIGAGTPATQVAAGAILRATVTQINGADVAPFDLTPVNASFGDALPGMQIVTPWSLGLTLDVAAQLAGLGYGANDDATKVEIVINNQLAAVSEPNTSAFIAKKEFRIDVGTDIPEPASIALAGMALCALFAAGRRREV